MAADEPVTGRYDDIEGLNNAASLPPSEHPPPLFTKADIRKHIGGLNGRRPFVSFLERILHAKAEIGATREDLLLELKRQHRYWSTLLRHEMARYDRMRDEAAGVRRSFALIHYEFDDLFRYCDDPTEQFDLDLHHPPDAGDAAAIAGRVEPVLVAARNGIPTSLLPLRLRSFIARIYISAFRSLPAFIRSKTGRRKRPTLWETTFREGRDVLNETEVLARRFWRRCAFTAVGFNAAMLAFMIAGLFELAGVDLVLGIVFVIAIDLLFIPIASRAVFQYYRFWLARSYGRNAGVARIRTWRDARRSIAEMRHRTDVHSRHIYREMVRDMAAGHVIGRDEYHRLIDLDPSVRPKSPQARRRIKRRLNKQDAAGITSMAEIPTAIPEIECWEHVNSLTILVFSLNERFAYHWTELTREGQPEDRLAESIIHKLRSAYPDEWAHLVEDLEDRLPKSEAAELRSHRTRYERVTSEAARNAVSRWANLRLQTIYNTLEGVSKTFKALEALAARFFPEESPDQHRVRARQKLQIILLHDLYPTYTADMRQKKDLDAYFGEHPEMELAWPEDMLHPSKSGAWANVLPRIKGDYLMTLDSDHTADLEEVYFIPNMLREFEHDSRLDALQFTLQTFNERYSWVARCAGLAGDAWWRQELRVKALIGGGGAFGKLVYRVAAIEPEELIQPDSVGEDMLTMARLQAADRKIGFVEYVQMGQGEEVTFEGIKRKYGRYPIGGLESSLSKLFVEMLRSTAPHWTRKAEALWMVCYYPLQVLIVVANILILTGLAFGITFSFLYLPLLLISAGYLVLISEGLLSIVNLTERHGTLRGVLKYLGYFFPMSIFHSSYVPFYLRQFGKGLRGYARFNVTVKRGELKEGTWDETYENNAWSVRYGAALLTLALFGMVASPLSTIGYIAYFPFFFSALVWTIGPFIFVPRRRILRKLLDVLFAMPYVIGRTFADFLDGLGRLLARTTRTLLGRSGAS